MKDIKDFDFFQLANDLSRKFNVTHAAADNLISGQADVQISDLLGVNISAVDCILDAEAHITIANKLGITFTDLDNLLKVYGKGLAVGLVMGYLIADTNSY